MRKRHKQAIEILKTLITCMAMAVFLALVIGIATYYMLQICIGAQEQPPRTDEEAAQMQAQAEPLVIETPEPATEGSITIYTPDSAIYGYFGEIDVISDGKDGSQIDIELRGWLVGEYQHGEPEE